MAVPATYQSNLSYIADGEEVEAGIANRTAIQLKQNTDYLLNQLNAVTSTENLTIFSVPVSSSTVVGNPVYFNPVAAQWQPGQAVIGKSTVTGVVTAKSTATLANVTLLGAVALNLTPVLDPGVPLSACRYYLSAINPGNLTNIPPSPFTVSVLTADGEGNVYVLPYQVLQGPQGPSPGPQGPQGPSGGPVGPQGPQGPTPGIRSGSASLSGVTSQVITFSSPLPGVGYCVNVFPLFQVPSGTLLWVSSLTISGFTLNSTNALTGSVSYFACMDT